MCRASRRTSNQRIEGAAIAPLRFANQVVVFDALLRPRLDLRRRQLRASCSDLCRRFCHAVRFYASERRRGCG